RQYYDMYDYNYVVVLIPNFLNKNTNSYLFARKLENDQINLVLLMSIVSLSIVEDIVCNRDELTGDSNLMYRLHQILPIRMRLWYAMRFLYFDRYENRVVR